MIADKDYFLDENAQLAKDESSAAFLLVRKGQEITADVAQKYNLKGKSGDANPEVETGSSVKITPATKAKTPSANK